jgi:hypothetical protein
MRSEIYGRVHSIRANSPFSLTIVFEAGNTLDIRGEMLDLDQVYERYFVCPGTTEYDYEALKYYVSGLVGKRIDSVEQSPAIEVQPFQAEGLVLHCDDGPFHLWMIALSDEYYVSSIFISEDLDLARAELVLLEYSAVLYPYVSINMYEILK